MKKAFQKILLLFAVITVIGHSIFPHFHLNDIEVTVKKHHHHDKQSTGNHHHDEEDNKNHPQSIFSYAQLDENFIPAKSHTQNFELSPEFLPALIITFLSGSYPVCTKPDFGYYKEYPPPEKNFPPSSHRGPPTA